MGAQLFILTSSCQHRFFSGFSQFFCSGSGLPPVSLQTSLWLEFWFSPDIFPEWKRLFRLLTKDPTSCFKKQRSLGFAYIPVHALHFGKPRIDYSVLLAWDYLLVSSRCTEVRPVGSEKQNQICAEVQLAWLLSLNLVRRMACQKAAVCFPFLFHYICGFNNSECYPWVVLHGFVRGCWAPGSLLPRIH